MNNNAMDLEINRLIHFKVYLTGEKKIADSTADGYVKRVLAICREENLTLEGLMGCIKGLYYEYSEGAKRELGMRSHNSYRAALKHFYHFVIEHHGKLDQPPKAASASEPKYRIEVDQFPHERFGVIKLRDKDGKVLDTAATMSRDTHSSDDMADDMALKALIMLIQNVYKKDMNGALDLMKTLGASFTLDGEKLF